MEIWNFFYEIKGSCANNQGPFCRKRPTTRHAARGGAFGLEPAARNIIRNTGPTDRVCIRNPFFSNLPEIGRLRHPMSNRTKLRIGDILCIVATLYSKYGMRSVA